MDFAHNFIFIGGLLLAFSIFAATISSRIGAPLLLVFLTVGLLFGEDGPGGIVFNDMELSFTVCSLALALILFDGGLRTSREHFKVAFKPALMLATVVAIMTAAVTGLGLWYWLDVPLIEGLLIGSTVASTDAAAVFLLLRQRKTLLKQRVLSTLEVESGLNDPVAVLLTVACIHVLLADASSGWLQLVGMFIKQMGIGAAAGYAGGVLLARVMDRLELVPGLHPIFAVSGALLVFGGTHLLGGSGFLAVYIAGLLVGLNPVKPKRVVRQFLDGMAWLSQITMLLILGLLVTPRRLAPDLPVAITAGIILIFLARPMAIVATLCFFRFPWREQVFIAWVGLRGAIPIYLAMLPSLYGVAHSFRYFNIAFIVVVFSLLLQGWTVNLAARLLGMVEKNETLEPEVKFS